MSTQISFDAAISASVKQAQINLTRNLSLENSLNTSESTAVSAQADKADRRESRAGLFYSLRRVSVIAVTIFFFAFSPMLTVSAVRQVISETYISWYDEYISVESVSEFYPPEVKDFECGYLPEGFELEYSVNYGAGKVKNYLKGDNYINISVRPDDNTSLTGLDNERSKFYILKVNGNEGLWMVSDDGYNLLMISQNGVEYVVSGYAGINIIINIFENIKIYL